MCVCAIGAYICRVKLCEKFIHSLGSARRLCIVSSILHTFLYIFVNYDVITVKLPFFMCHLFCKFCDLSPFTKITGCEVCFLLLVVAVLVKQAKMPKLKFLGFTGFC